MSDLLIKINADAKNAQKAFDDLKEQTSELDGQLNKIALISGAAFAAFTAEIFFSVKAFEEATAASLELNNALQNQGIYSDALKDKYKDFATAVQAKTGIDDDAITKAQAVAQSFLGQTQITEQLSFAIADLGAKMGGDLNGAAEKIARTIGTGTNAFARQGLVIAEGSTEAERYAKVLEFVQLKAGGLAAEFNKADGYTKALATAFGNFQEEIGSRFAPAIAAVRQAFVSFFNFLSSSPILTDLIASFIAAGAVVAGLVSAVAIAIPIFSALTAAAAAFGVTMNIAFLGIPLLIGAVVAGLTFLALNWDKTFAILKSTAVGAVTFLAELFSGLGTLLKGVFSFDGSQIEAGLATLKGAFKKAKDEAAQTYAEIRASQTEEGVKQSEDKLALANKEAQKEREHQANLRAIRTAELDLLKLQNEFASQQTIELKQKEIEVLKALDQEKSDAEIALLKQKHDLITGLQEEQNAEDLERAVAFKQLQADTENELEAQQIEVEGELRQDKLAELRAQAMTELDIDRKLQEDMLSKRIAARNEELLNRKKYGEAYAIINKFIQSDEVQGAKSAAGELVQLQNSKNETLKGIGKAAAITQIGIATTESAMNIYRGFSTIPIIGPALGIAGAAAAIAYGGERISAVTAAADGGLIEGGVPGQDSVPALLMPGELVVPKRNFNDVVGPLQNQGGGSSDPEMLATLNEIRDNLKTPQQTIIQGDVHADESYIDSLVRKISDAVEFRNAQITGVTS